MERYNSLSFRGRKEWRGWLEKNSAKEKEAWLLHSRRNSGKKGLSPKEAVAEAICFGWIDGKLKKIDDERFIVRYSPRNPKSVWSKINRQTAERMAREGKMAPAGLLAIKDGKKSGNWSKAYTNKKKEALPSDLKNALMKNKGAWNNFQKFANSYWNMYLGWVNGAKTNETRKKRIKKVVNQSKQNKKLAFQ